jgi:hypothetical protein
MFYKIEECIGRGFYIVWDGIHETRESAENEIIRRGARDAALGRIRVMQYRRGNGSNGPERVNKAEKAQ